MYLVNTPWWLRALYPSLTWSIKNPGKKIYLTFDDGPHETATPFVLDQLKQFNAKATFFCIGKNVEQYPEIYNRILSEGHSTGNHTQNHLNGWKVTDEEYLSDIKQAATFINSSLFRPPYGRIKRSQQKKLQTSNPSPSLKIRGTGKLQTIMWSVLSGDFDTNLTPEACLAYVLYHTKAGSIIVFHDSAKAWERCRMRCPKCWNIFRKKGMCSRLSKIQYYL